MVDLSLPYKMGDSGDIIIISSSSGLDNYCPEPHVYMAIIYPQEGDDVKSQHDLNETVSHISNDD